MTKFRKLVEGTLKDYVNSAPEEMLDEDFKSGLKKTLGTALVGGGLLAGSHFLDGDQTEYLNQINAGVEGDLPKVIEVQDAGGLGVYFKLEDGELIKADEFMKMKEDLLNEQKGIREAADEYEQYETCSWCNEELPRSELRKEKDLGYLCNHCIKGLESREGELDFEDD